MTDGPDPGLGPALDPGERVEFRVPAGDGALVVTDGRVFRLLSGGDVVGSVPREAVADAEVSTHVPRQDRHRGALAAVTAAACWLAAWLVYPFAPAVPVERDAASRMGVGGAVDSLRTVVELAGYLDDALALVGVALAVYAGVVVLLARRQVLALERADGETARLRAPALDEADAERLRGLLGADA